MSNSRARIVLLLAVVAFAAASRLAWLESTPLWWDEFVTLGRAKLHPGALWTSLSYQGPSDSSLDSSPPLLHFILHGVLALGGASETWVKLPSAVFGALTVLVMYPLGTRLFGGRSGLYASALLGFSLYHMHYSREARPYALYLLLAACSLWLLLRALDLNRFRDWAACALASAATLYASYLGGASLAALGGYLAALALSGRMPPGRTLPAFASVAFAALAYLPWLPGHLFHMELIYSPGGDMGLTPAFLGRAFMEFTSGSGLYLACAAFGAAVGMHRHPAKAALLYIWLALPVAAALVLRTGIAVNPRYLVNFVPGLALLAGAGLDGLVRGVSLALPGRAAALLGLVAAVGLSWPGLTRMPDYYRRDSHSVRDDLLEVAVNAANADTLAFPRNRHLKVFARWYLPGLFGDLSQSGDLGYRRVMLLSGPEFTPDLPGEAEAHGDLRAFRIGLLNVSPLPAPGPYKADFSNLSLYREAAFWDNIGPDLFRKSLTLYDPERPGRVLWRFTAPEGGFPAQVTLRCRLRLDKSRATPPPDASLAVLAGASPESLKAAAAVTHADFKAGQELDLTLAVPATGPELTAGIHMDPGTIHGGIEVVSFDLDFPERPAIPVPAAERLRGRAKLVPWAPGVVRTGDGALFGFAPDDPRLSAFLAEHPGIEPVASLPDLVLYDPALLRPRIDLPGPAVLYAGRSLQGIRVTGPFSGQTLALGGFALPLPLNAPPGSALEIAPGGQGRIRAGLDFSSGSTGAFLSFNTELPEGSPSVTCRGENGCFLVYALRSPAPVRTVRVAWTPEAYGEPGQENGVRLSYSTDGSSYRPVDAMSVRNSELWEGKYRCITRIELNAPSTLVYLRFDLTSDKARLWAGPATPLCIDAWTDPPAKLPAALPETPFKPVNSGPPVQVYLSPAPLPDLDGLLAPH
ncbi:MAG: glycosyltransferase family 39 protein [Thermodesulfobacteriota bacterium]